MFAEAEKLELLYAHEDLDIAGLIQFSAIYAFTRLISSLLEETALVKQGEEVDFRQVVARMNTRAANSESELKNLGNNSESELKNLGRNTDSELKNLAGEYKRLTRLGGFLGIWVYIAAGCLRETVSIVIAMILQFKVQDGVEDPMVTFLEDADQSFEGFTSSAFGLLTLLSVVNMVIMSGTYIVTDKLGDANKKFLGARLMLLTSEIAPKIVDAFANGTPLHRQLTPVLKHAPFLHMNQGHAEMLKVAILNSVCLVTVIMTAVFWKDVNINEDDENGLLDFPTDEKVAKTLLDFPTDEEVAKTMDDTDAPLLDHVK